MRYTHGVYSLLGLRYESVDRLTLTSYIPSAVAVESREAVDKISAYIDQRRAVHLRQLMLEVEWKQMAFGQTDGQSLLHCVSRCAIHVAWSVV